MLNEVAAHWSRSLDDAISSLRTASKKVRKASSPIRCDVQVDHPSPSALSADFQRAAAETVARFEIEVVPYTRRSAEEFFGYATRYVLPFEKDEEGKGFQDAVILVSILDHLRRRPTFGVAHEALIGCACERDWRARFHAANRPRPLVVNRDASSGVIGAITPPLYDGSSCSRFRCASSCAISARSRALTNHRQDREPRQQETVGGRNLGQRRERP